MPKKRPPPKKCPAKCKDGTPCPNYAVVGGRFCRNHRHNEVNAGIRHPNFKSGKYSKYLPKRLVSHYEEARADKDLLSLRDDIALLETRQTELEQRLDTGESGAAWSRLHVVFAMFKQALRSGDQDLVATHLSEMGSLIEQGYADVVTWDEIRTTIALKEKLTASERKRLLELQQYLTVERVMVLVTALTDTVRKHVSDPEALRLIALEFGRTLNNSERDATEVDEHYKAVTPYVLPM